MIALRGELTVSVEAVEEGEKRILGHCARVDCFLSLSIGSCLLWCIVSACFIWSSLGYLLASLPVSLVLGTSILPCP